MEGQDQEKFVIVSVSGPAKAVSEMLNRLASVDEPLDVNPFDRVKVVKTTAYDYTDESGRVLYRVVRRDYSDGTKDFVPMIIGRDGEKKGFGCGDRRVPYNLPRLLQVAKKGGTVAVCNGERAADEYERLHGTKDVAATTFFGGLRSFSPRRYAGLADYFSGVGKVVIVHDGMEPINDS